MPPPAPSASPIPLEVLIAGLVVVGFRGETLTDGGWVARALRAGLGGVILFDRDQETGGARNVRSPAQVRRLTADLRAAAGRTPIIAIDQEGGLVTRLSPKHGYPAVESEAAIGAGTAAHARRWARDLAATLGDAGVTLNLAPVVDLDVNRRSPAIGALGRSFSADAEVVVTMAGIEVAAHRAAGVATALKHFPGIGSSTANTDDGSVDVTRTWHRAELEPFRRLIEADRADLVMVGHVRNDRLDPDRPASQSRAIVTDLLRGQLGWEGIVVTDDLQAGAVAADGPAEAAIRALEAGADLLLFANQQGYDDGIVDTVVAAIAGAVDAGRLDRAGIEAAAARVGALFPPR
ncbi:MAG TPA: glycoside hydrolase family 3 N-terminal domain-containing protein [Candidatus Limnocylindrales bacterium]